VNKRQPTSVLFRVCGGKDHLALVMKREEAPSIAEMLKDAYDEFDKEYIYISFSGEKGGEVNISG